MSYIKGSPLNGMLWASLSLDQRTACRDSLQEIVNKLRSIPVPPSARIGSIGQQTALLVSPSCIDPPVPSFDDEIAMFNWMANRFARATYCPLRDRLRVTAPGGTSKLVFTHGDLAPRNILIKRGQVVGLVDWELSGWYPEYFERTRCELEVERGPRGPTNMILSLLDASENVATTSLYADYCNTGR